MGQDGLQAFLAVYLEAQAFQAVLEVPADQKAAATEVLAVAA